MRTRTALAVSSPAWLVLGVQGLLLATSGCADPPGAVVVLPVLVGVLAAAQTVVLALAGARGRVVLGSALLGALLLGGSIVLYVYAILAPVGCGDWSWP